MSDPLISFDIESVQDPLHSGKVLTEFEQEKIAKFVTEYLPNLRRSELYSAKALRAMPREIFNKDYYKQLTREGRSSVVRGVIYAAVVRQVCIRKEIPVPDEESIKNRFSFFEAVDLTTNDPQEIAYLCKYVRAIETLQFMGMPASNQKQMFMRVAAMLEGSNNRYATGGAPAKTTKRREIIFTEITQIAARIRDVVPRRYVSYDQRAVL